MKYVCLYGLGKYDESKCVIEWGKSSFEKLGEKASEIYKSLKIGDIGFAFTAIPETELPSLIIQKVIKGLSLGAYKPTRYKEQKKALPKLKSITFIKMGKNDIIEEGGKNGIAFSSGVGLTRYLVESPANVCSPQYIADAAKVVAETYPEYFTLKVSNF